MKQNQIFKILVFLLLSSCSVLHLTPSKKIEEIKFTDGVENEIFKFIYQNKNNSPELATLITEYRLDSVANLGTTEFEKILQLLNWTNSRWAHNGSNRPSKSNAITILKEADEGKKFRCVEYGIVLRSVLASNGLNARTLGLQTKDVEVTRFGAGHVLTEVWSTQYNKWFMLDAQFNVVPVLDNIPLNAVEFQDAIFHDKSFKLVDLNGEVDIKHAKKYMKFIPPYLYYFDFKFDQRELPYENLIKVNDNGLLMLVPVGAKNPTIFQRKIKMDYYEYTNSLNDFYRKPEENPSR